MSISVKLERLIKNLPKHVTLVAVSKTKSHTDILEAYNTGQRIFGENKVQELVEKAESLPKDINWHMIGHLQSNKIKYIVSFVSLIHGVDSIKLLKEINKRAKQKNRIIECLLQIHIATERSKFGFGFDEIEQALIDTKALKNIRIVGLMGMATFTNNIQQIENEFHSLKLLFNQVKNNKISILSMGMSGDYKIAIDNGSNMIRIGSSIFGER